MGFGKSPGHDCHQKQERGDQDRNADEPAYNGLQQRDFGGVNLIVPPLAHPKETKKIAFAIRAAPAFRGVARSSGTGICDRYMNTIPPVRWLRNFVKNTSISRGIRRFEFAKLLSPPVRPIAEACLLTRCRTPFLSLATKRVQTPSNIRAFAAHFLTGQPQSADGHTLLRPWREIPCAAKISAGAKLEWSRKN